MASTDAAKILDGLASQVKQEFDTLAEEVQADSRTLHRLAQRHIEQMPSVLLADVINEELNHEWDDYVHYPASGPEGLLPRCGLYSVIAAVLVTIILKDQVWCRSHSIQINQHGAIANHPPSLLRQLAGKACTYFVDTTLPLTQFSLIHAIRAVVAEVDINELPLLIAEPWETVPMSLIEAASSGVRTSEAQLLQDIVTARILHALIWYDDVWRFISDQHMRLDKNNGTINER